MLFYIYTERVERCVCVWVVCGCECVGCFNAELHVITLSDSSIRLSCFYLLHMQICRDSLMQFYEFVSGHFWCLQTDLGACVLERMSSLSFQTTCSLHPDIHNHPCYLYLRRNLNLHFCVNPVSLGRCCICTFVSRDLNVGYHVGGLTLHPGV